MILCPTQESFIVENEKSSLTLELPQPQTTASKQARVGARLGNVPVNRRPSSQPELVGKQFGNVMVISPDALWLGPKHRRFMHVLCECTKCGYRSMIDFQSLESGRSKGCRPCGNPRQVPAWLYARAANQKKRCNNPNDPRWRDYGGRGIEFRFSSPTEAALWVIKELGIPENYADLQLDRINNNGHYEPGNIRWATGLLNHNNTRKSKWTPLIHQLRMKHPEIRYADATLRSLFSNGFSTDQIIERFHKPSHKPKGKYGTYSIADPEIASLVKGC